MSWKLIERQRRRLAREQGAVVKGWGGKLTVCLVFPNRYRTAMSNLGLQAVYGLLNAEADVLCERAFLPEREELAEYAASGSRLISLESQRPVAEFDIVAFAVSFEQDYLALPTLLRLAGIPAFAGERSAAHPLVMAGGAALFLNPEPVAELLDLVAVGEAEVLLPPLLTAIRSHGLADRQAFLAVACQLPGWYVPSRYRLAWQGTRLLSREALPPAPAQVPRLVDHNLAGLPARTIVSTPETEFADLQLVEVTRGCPRGCRFCAAGFIYHPYRQWPLAAVQAAVAEGLAAGRKIGLVGAAVSDYRHLAEVCQQVTAAGGAMSVSSLRLDAIDDVLLTALVQSGHKTVAIAPEGGSQRLRDLVRKGLDEEQILAACDRLIAQGILNLKLYVIVGLPTEERADLDELLALVHKIRARVVAAAKAHGRLGEIVLSVNPFVPKPWTPLQWCGMAPAPELEARLKYLQQALKGCANVRLQAESVREAELQAVLSRGGRWLAEFLVAADQLGSWKRAAKELARERGIDLAVEAQRWLDDDELFPWEVIEGGPGRSRLLTEYHTALGKSK